MLESISLIVSVASGILNAVQSATALKGTRRANVSVFLGEIADTLDIVVNKFKAGEIPHGACQEMLMYAQNLSVLDGILPVDTIMDYTNKLMYAHNVEMLYATISNDSTQLIELEKAAGTFRAASNLMKI